MNTNPDELETAVRIRASEKRSAVAQMNLDKIRDEIAGILGSTMTGAAIRRRLERLLTDTTPDPLQDSVRLAIEKGESP